MRVRQPIAALALIASCACGGGDPLQPAIHASRPASQDDRVVAEVGGEPIYLSRVVELSERTGRPAREVLEGMVEMSLLAREAEGRGLLGSPGVRRTFKKALVQRLLEHEVEARVSEDSVSADDIRAYYVQHYRNKGMLIEDVWRDIWARIVAERRAAVYVELVDRLRSRTRVVVDEEMVEKYLGEGGG